MNVARLARMRWLLGTLLIVAAALFAVGVATEGDVHHETVASVEAGEHDAAAEHNERAEASDPAKRSLASTSNRPRWSCSLSSSQ